jgi:hypothetical protein
MVSKKDKLIEAEIRDFGKSIGINYFPSNNHSSNRQHTHGANILHELGHWAVFPDFYIDIFNEFKQKCAIGRRHFNVPSNSTWVMRYYFLIEQNILLKIPESKIKHDENVHFIEFYYEGKKHKEHIDIMLVTAPFPDEWGVQEWCYQVANKFGWEHCKGRWWSNDSDDYRDWFENIFSDITREGQLKNAGIDIENNVFRPTITSMDFYRNQFRFLEGDKVKIKLPIRGKNIIGNPICYC